MPHKVRFSPGAVDDLIQITEWITKAAGEVIAYAYADRIRARCETLADFPSRGRQRRKAGNIRSVAFRRSAAILYRVTRSEVVILRVLHSGRDIWRDIAAIT